MNHLFRRITAFVLSAAALTGGPRAAAQDVPPVGPDGPSVRARGPVHEAFARPADGPTRGPLVAKAPPAPVQEIPPDQRPDLAGVQWIPGYWAWDDEAVDYLWVSGCWRVPPPGRQWVAGAWGREGNGWRWQSGFWAAAGANAPQPVPDTPPATLEAGPSSPPPDENGYYVPGQWLFRNGEWVWQPGTWVRNPADMVYVPPTYLPAQNGSVYVPGYWDYPLQNRGLLFAPVAFGGAPLGGNPGWAYQPGYTVGLGGLLGSLFLRPGSGSYYFGNYFGGPYQGLGYRPWTAYGRRGYDPLLNYYRWANRGTPGWYGGLSGLYAGRLNGSLPVPPAVFSRQVAATPALAPGLVARHTVPFGRGVSVTPVNSLRIVQPLTQASHARLTSVSPVERIARPALQPRTAFASPGGGGSFPGTVAPGGGARLVSPSGQLVPSFGGGVVPGTAWRPAFPTTVTPATHHAPSGYRYVPGPTYHALPGPTHHAPPGYVHHAAPGYTHHAMPGSHPGYTHHPPGRAAHGRR